LSQPVSSAAGSASATREKLLEAAEAVFADRGFRDAGVREICRVARVNLAAVNYHFGSKEGLYSAVLRQAFERANPDWPMPRLGDAPDRPEEQLRLFVRWFLERMAGESRIARLILAELRSPTAALDALVDASMRPIQQELIAILAAVSGLDPTDPRVLRAATGVLGQCLVHRMCRPVLDRLFEGDRSWEAIDPLADHVFTFSLAGIRAILADGSGRADTGPAAEELA